jgi:hypothetical protein
MLDWRQDYLQRERQRRVVRRVAVGLVAAAALIGAMVYVAHKLQDAEETRLNLQVANLRAERASAASDAARAAQASAESAAREAQLTLEAGRLALEAERAQMQGQLARAKALSAEQAAKEQSARMAREEAARRGAEAKAKLAEADKSQAKIDDVAQAAKQKGISILGVPAQKGPPNEKYQSDGPVTGTAAAPPTSTSTSVPPVEAVRPETPNLPVAGAKPPEAGPSGGAPIVAGNYKETYRKAIEAKNQKRWQQAVTLFETAIKQNGTESTERINIAGFGNVEPYVPHYYLGVALKNLNNCTAAMDEWNVSLDQGAIRKTNLFKSLQENVVTCAEEVLRRSRGRQ